MWPKGIAVGKLSLVKAEGRDPRLVLDSTICQVTVHQVRRSFQPHDPPGAYTAASIDFKAARKSVKVHSSEQGLLLFAFYWDTVALRSVPLWSQILSLLVAAGGRLHYRSDSFHSSRSPTQSLALRRRPTCRTASLLLRPGGQSSYAPTNSGSTQPKPAYLCGHQRQPVA